MLRWLYTCILFIYVYFVQYAYSRVVHSHKHLLINRFISSKKNTLKIKLMTTSAWWLLCSYITVVNVTRSVPLIIYSLFNYYYSYYKFWIISNFGKSISNTVDLQNKNYFSWFKRYFFEILPLYLVSIEKESSTKQYANVLL